MIGRKGEKAKRGKGEKDRKVKCGIAASAVSECFRFPN
jgi:hypothetical protein